MPSLYKVSWSWLFIIAVETITKTKLNMAKVILEDGNADPGQNTYSGAGFILWVWFRSLKINAVKKILKSALNNLMRDDTLNIFPHIWKLWKKCKILMEPYGILLYSIHKQSKK